MAKLHFKYGAMNSGKTTLLLQTIYNYEEQGMKVLLLKPVVDTKGGSTIVSRIGLKRIVDHLIVKDEILADYLNKNILGISCIFVDEAQFLSKKQVDELMETVIKYDIPVMCYGLRTDFKLNGFEGSSRLLEIAHILEEMKTICKCGKKAIYNARFIDGIFTSDGDQIAIDDKKEIKYEAMCPGCFYKYKNKEG